MQIVIFFRQTFSKDNWQKITPVLRFGEKRNALKYNNVNFFTNFTLRWGSLRNRIILIRQNSLFKGITFKFGLGYISKNIFHCNQEIVSVKFIGRKSIFSVKHWVFVLYNYFPLSCRLPINPRQEIGDRMKNHLSNFEWIFQRNKNANV